LIISIIGSKSSEDLLTCSGIGSDRRLGSLEGPPPLWRRCKEVWQPLESMLRWLSNAAALIGSGHPQPRQVSAWDAHRTHPLGPHVHCSAAQRSAIIIDFESGINFPAAYAIASCVALPGSGCNAEYSRQHYTVNMCVGFDQSYLPTLPTYYWVSYYLLVPNEAAHFILQPSPTHREHPSPFCR